MAAAARLRASRIITEDNYPSKKREVVIKGIYDLITNRNSQTFHSVAGLDFVVTSYAKVVFIAAVDRTLENADQIRGFIKLQPADRKHDSHWVDGVWAHPSIRGRGLGVLLYSSAVGILKDIQSDPFNIGIMAIKTWQKLAKIHEVTLNSQSTRTPVAYTWGSNGIPLVNDMPINKLTETFYFNARTA